MKQIGRSKMTVRKAIRQRKKLILLSGAVLAIALIVFLGSYLVLRAKVNKVPKNIICDNIYIGEINVSGMNAKEAKKALEKQVAEYQELTVTLVAEEEKKDVTLGELGFYINNMDKQVEKAVAYGKKGSIWSRYQKIKKLDDKDEGRVEFAVSYDIDAKLTKKVISAEFSKLKGAAVDATIKRENGQFIITDGKKGVMVDSKESIKVIETYFNDKWSKEGGSIELVTKVDEPNVTREQLEQVKDLLGTFTTVCGTGGGRVQNIETGARHINGTLLMPGEEYSANGAMEPYTVENGFTEAGSYENGKVVQSMGGGICQVSSTLYNAVINAELEIVERAAHSMLVSYVEPSMDAAIAGDFKDLKFKNNQKLPIYIEGYVSGGRITFNIYGKETRDPSRKVTYVPEIVSQTPAGKKFVASNDPIGTMKKASSGYTGMKTKLWKVVTENGVEVSRTVRNNSTYSASAAIYNVGIATDNAQAAAIVNNAIATQDEATINAAIAQAKALIAASQQTTPAQPTTPTTPTTPETTPGT